MAEKTLKGSSTKRRIVRWIAAHVAFFLVATLFSPASSLADQPTAAGPQLATTGVAEIATLGLPGASVSRTDPWTPQVRVGAWARYTAASQVPTPTSDILLPVVCAYFGWLIGDECASHVGWGLMSKIFDALQKLETALELEGEPLDVAQELLGHAGLVPGIGIVFDVSNAAISLARNNYGDAIFYAAAAVPAVGVSVYMTVRLKKANHVFKQARNTDEAARLARGNWVREAVFEVEGTGKYATRVRGTGLRRVEQPAPKLQSDQRRAIKRAAGVADDPDWTVDHTIPRALGGTNEEHNLKVLHVAANNKKSAIERILSEKSQQGIRVSMDVTHLGPPGLKPRASRIEYTIGRREYTVEIPNGPAAKGVSIPAVGILPLSLVPDVWHGAGNPNGAGLWNAPVLSVRRGNRATDNGSCPASAGCRWVVGSGSGWPAHEQFWIRCGSFVDTSRNHPVNYRARYVDANGNLSWGEQICYSGETHTVEVWTTSGARNTTTIHATQAPQRSDPQPVVQDSGLEPGTTRWYLDPSGFLNSVRRSDPVLSVKRGNRATDNGSCPASAGCRWVVGSGSGWPAHEQFWIRCGSFVDTSRNHPVNYRARYVDANGNLSWGEQICYSGETHTVEVWTTSGARNTTTIHATQAPQRSDPQPVVQDSGLEPGTTRWYLDPSGFLNSVRRSDPVLSVKRGNRATDNGSCPASAGCRWVVGSGSGWPAHEQFWIRCGSFVDTSRNHPVNYRARYVDANGNLSWGEQICYSGETHTVEVWTTSGARNTTTIHA